MAELTFEQAMTRLEQIVATLEGGRCTLDDSLKLFEEGTKLTAVENGEDGKTLSDRQGEDMGEELSL